ncbi:PRA1 family protein [Rhynchospora pubera]|uniref:PRA1 family protein n=1 Tax=Rhynchospora pubera TaxID=906938 RepID=A0AAV8HPU2_9POAL|nr:PRA1 family protein [Rhynchospora pubera]
MRSANPTTTSSYGTIRSAPPPSPAVHIADPPLRSSAPPSYGATMPPSFTPAGATWATPSYTTYAPTAGYIKVPTTDPSQHVAVPAAIPPPELQPSSAVRISDVVSKFKEQGHALFSARRPWQELFHPPSFSRPINIGDAINRIRRNATYFRANYILVILGVLLLGLFYHPFSFFACAALAASWFFLYFSRTGPLVILGRTIDDGSVLLWLTVATVVSLLFTNVGWNVIGSMAVGVAVVGVHAGFRSTDDLFLTEQEAAGSGLVNPNVAQFVAGSGLVNPSVAQFAQVL